LKKKAERITTKMGVRVTNTELFIGVDSCRPLKKESMLIPIPNRAQTRRRGQSLLSIFSRGPNRDTIQKRRAAPVTRTMIKAKGWIWSGITPLAKEWFRP